MSADSWTQWLDYFLFRDLKDDKPLGSEDAVVYFTRQDLPRSEGLLR